MFYLRSLDTSVAFSTLRITPRCPKATHANRPTHASRPTYSGPLQVQTPTSTNEHERNRSEHGTPLASTNGRGRQRSVGGLCLLPWLPPCHPHLSGFCSWALHATTCRTPGRRNEPSGQGLSGTATIARGGRPIDGPERMVLEMGLERTSGSGRGLSRPLLHSRYWKGSQVQLTTSFNEHCTSLKQGQRPMGQG